MPPTDATPTRRSSKRPRPTFDVAPPSAEATGAGWVYRSTPAPAPLAVEPLTPEPEVSLAQVADEPPVPDSIVVAAPLPVTSSIAAPGEHVETLVALPTAAPPREAPAHPQLRRVARVEDRAWVATAPAPTQASGGLRVGDMMGMMTGVLTAPVGIGAAMLAMPVCWLLNARRGSTASADA